MRLNLGCGHLNRQKGEIGLDYHIACKPDVQGDAQNLPFKNESFNEIYASHCLEHIPDIVSTVNECWRVLKHDGTFLVRVPLFPTVGSISDPTHVRYFIVPTFDYFTQNGKLTGLKNIFKMDWIRINNLTSDTQEIECRMIK